MSAANGEKQSGVDVFLSQDIVPPCNKKILQKRDYQKMETDDVPADADDLERKKGKIPKFDLAEEIMAEQRKITAIRRKAPLETRRTLGPRTKALMRRV